MNKINLKKQVTKKDPVKDERDVKIDKLKQVNLKLRQRLKDLNVQLEKTIDKANSRKVQKSLQAQSQMQAQKATQETVTDHQIKVKEKELRNAQNQVELYKRELQQLQLKVDDLSGVDRLLLLENRLRDGIQEKSDLEKKVKELERQHKDQGKALEKMSNEEEF